MEDGRLKRVNLRWMMEDERWEMEDGSWKVEDERWKGLGFRV